jgi:hypothetical protein
MWFVGWGRGWDVVVLCLCFVSLIQVAGTAVQCGRIVERWNGMMERL